MKKQLYQEDNLNVLRSMEEGSVGLVYLDPPFNSNRNYNTTPQGDADAFRDVWRHTDAEQKAYVLQHPGLKALLRVATSVDATYEPYLVFMGVRLLEMPRILKATGSVYLHCDPTMSHFLKIMMDCIFGVTNFRNEIIWYYNSGARRKKDFGRRHDVILRYSRTDEYFVDFENQYAREAYSPDINVPASKKHYYHAQGKVRDDVWRMGIIAQNNKKERVGYPTQKPIELLKRIIGVSTRVGDVVLDPFCGSGTTLVVCEEMQRGWMGVDANAYAIRIAQQRLASLGCSVTPQQIKGR